MVDVRSMRRLVNHDPALAEEFLRRVRDTGATDYGNSILEQMHEELQGTQKDRYAAPEIRHVRRETEVTRLFDAAVSLFGWRELIAGLSLFALNRQARLSDYGLPEAAVTWGRIADVVAALPKNPQL